MNEATGNVAETTHASRLVELGTLAFLAVIAKLAATALGPLQETVRIAFALSDNDMALLQGPALALPMVLLAVPIGVLIDHTSRVRLLRILTVLVAAGSGLTMVAANFAVMFAGRCLVGFSSSTLVIIGFSLLADWYPPERRGRIKAILVLGQYVGASAAFALGGKLLAIFSWSDGWRWTLFWLTAPALALAICLLATMREPPRTGVLIRKPPSRELLVELWQYRWVVTPLTLGIILAEIPIFAVLTWAAPAFSRTHSLSPGQVGAIMGTTLLVGGIVGPLSGGFLADICQRVGGPRRTVLAISILALISAPMGLFPVVPGTGAAGVLICMFFTIIAAAVNMAATLFTIVIPNELRGLCLSVMTAGVSLFGMMLAPLAVSILSGAIGGPHMVSAALAIVCVTGSLLCAAVFGVGRKFMSYARAL
jgi:MFS family permease